MAISSAILPLGRSLRAIPLKLMIVLILLSLWVGEYFPILQFGMYSRMSGKAWTVVVTDETDEPLRVRRFFRTSTTKLQKRYKQERRRLHSALKAQGFDDHEARAIRGAAAIILEKIAANPSEHVDLANYTALKLWRINYRLDGRVLEREWVLLGEVDLP